LCFDLPKWYIDLDQRTVEMHALRRRFPFRALCSVSQSSEPRKCPKRQFALGAGLIGIGAGAAIAFPLYCKHALDDRSDRLHTSDWPFTTDNTHITHLELHKEAVVREAGRAAYCSEKPAEEGFCAKVDYTYSWNGKQYVGHDFWFHDQKLILEHAHSRQAAVLELKRFLNAKDNIKVYVNPANPSESCLFAGTERADEELVTNMVMAATLVGLPIAAAGAWTVARALRRVPKV
jgi:hypothetical protein